jgi:hypothetical protein
MTIWPALASRETAFVHPALLLTGPPFGCLPPGAVGLLADVFPMTILVFNKITLR